MAIVHVPPAVAATPWLASLADTIVSVRGALTNAVTSGDFTAPALAHAAVTLGCVARGAELTFDALLAAVCEIVQSGDDPCSPEKDAVLLYRWDTVGEFACRLPSARGPAGRPLSSEGGRAASAEFANSIRWFVRLGCRG